MDEQAKRVRITTTVLGQEYLVDYEDELKVSMVAHNARCRLKIINSPEKFPRADMDHVSALFEAEQEFLATQGIVV